MALLIGLLLVVGQTPATAVDSLPARIVLVPPAGVRASDTPYDQGKSVTLNWQPVEGAEGYALERTAAGQTPEAIGGVPAGETGFVDETALNGIAYTYRVGAFAGADTVWSAASTAAVATAQWLDLRLLNIFIAMVLFFGLILYFVNRARQGKALFVRRIAGLDAVEESVGRSTEMGKPIVFIPGIGSAAAISTIASMNILGEIAKKTAQYDTTLVVPNSDPVVYTIAREMVKEAHAKVGRPDSFKPDDIFFVTQEQFAYAAAVDGIMVREKPATIFMLGWFAAEALILAETGSTTGAIQIAGTDAIYQLPFFITACDYTLIGEELYAASAYLSREPLLLGSLVGQDYGKLAILIALGLASALNLLSAIKGLDWLGFALKALGT